MPWRYRRIVSTLLPLSKLYARYPLRRDSGNTEPPVFVIGSGRNGSTLLASILNEHQDALVVPEQFFFHISYLRFRLFNFLPWPSLVKLILSKASAPEVTAGWKTDFKNVIPEVQQVARNQRSLRKIYEAMYQQYRAARKPNCKVLIDKTPLNSQHVSELLELFPDARYVFLNRDGRDVVSSYMNGSEDVFGEMHLLENASEFWAHCLNEWNQLSNHLPSYRCYTLRYEDLTHRPEQTLQGLLDFLGLDVQTGLLAFQSQHEQLGVSEMAHHQNLKKPLSADSIGRYKRDRSSEEIERIEELIGNELESCGYALGQS